MSGQFGTSADVSHGHFGTGTDVSRPPADIFATTIGCAEVRLLLSKRTTGLHKNTLLRTSDYTHVRYSNRFS